MFARQKGLGENEELEMEYFRAVVRQVARPGIEMIFRSLAELNIPAGIISNAMFSSKALSLGLKYNHIGFPFKFLLSSSDIGFQKPHAVIFEAALGRLGVSASEAWYIGDSYECDVRGAIGAGLRAFWLRNEEEVSAQDHRSDFTELLGWANFLPIIESVR